MLTSVWSTVVLAGLFAFGIPVSAVADQPPPAATEPAAEEAVEKGLPGLEVVLDLDRPSDNDILILRNGDRLTGTVQNASFAIRTSYAHITLNTRIIAGIDLEGGSNHIESIVTVNNNRFSGFIDDPGFAFRLQSGPRIDVRREKVLKAIYRVRKAERQGLPQRAFILLKNGDYFSGKVLNENLALRTTYARVPLRAESIEKIKFIGRDTPLTTVTLLNGDQVQGVLETEDIDIELDVGPTVQIYQDRIEMVFMREGYVPDNLATLQERPPRGDVGQSWTDSYSGVAFVWVPGGKFEMGCGAWTDACDGDESPVHPVTLDGFWLGKTEVTQAQWQKVMEGNPSHFKKNGDHPVERVSWNDAQAFIQKLNAQNNGTFRLPSEAEWEYACRSGGKPEKYAGGSEVGAVAWYDGNAGSTTHAVGRKSANGLGLFDMSGNVWEWVQDAKQGYPASAQNNPIYESGANRVRRGGSWRNSASRTRCTVRSRDSPGRRCNYLGFRLLRKN